MRLFGWRLNYTGSHRTLTPTPFHVKVRARWLWVPNTDYDIYWGECYLTIASRCYWFTLDGQRSPAREETKRAHERWAAAFGQ